MLYYVPFERLPRRRLIDSLKTILLLLALVVLLTLTSLFLMMYTSEWLMGEWSHGQILYWTLLGVAVPGWLAIMLTHHE